MKHSSSKPAEETSAAKALILDFLPQSCKGINFFCYGTLRKLTQVLYGLAAASRVMFSSTLMSW